MSIQVKFFASLKEQVGHTHVEIPHQPGLDMALVWSLSTDRAERPAHALCARNHEHCDWQTPVADGDEVAFFPPVTGG